MFNTNVILSLKAFYLFGCTGCQQLTDAKAGIAGSLVAGMWRSCPGLNLDCGGKRTRKQTMPSCSTLEASKETWKQIWFSSSLLLTVMLMNLQGPCHYETFWICIECSVNLFNSETIRQLHRVQRANLELKYVYVLLSCRREPLNWYFTDSNQDKVFAGQVETGQLQFFILPQ